MLKNIPKSTFVNAYIPRLQAPISCASNIYLELYVIFQSFTAFTTNTIRASSLQTNAGESTRTCTEESFHVPDTTADPQVDGAEARKTRLTDGTGAMIAAEATSFDEPLDRQTRAK